PGKRIVATCVVVQRCSATIGRKVVGAEPTLPQHNGVRWKASYIFDEAREMKRDLRIGRLIERIRRRDRLGLTEMVDLHHPWRDGALGGLPEEAGGEPSRQQQTSECHQPPVSGLNARRPDALIPNLGRLLVRCHRLWRAAVMNGWSREHHCPPSDRSTED